MFPPIPPNDETRQQPAFEHDQEAVQTIPSWRPRARWPALLRLAWLCRLFAILTLGFGLIWALVMAILAFGNRESLLALVMAASILVSSVVTFFIWLGLAEAILVFIAIERNTRQTRDRLHKLSGEGSLLGGKDF